MIKTLMKVGGVHRLRSWLVCVCVCVELLLEVLKQWNVRLTACFASILD